MSNIPYIGEICALAAAVCWAFATILFRKTGESIRPLALNLFKNTLTLLFFIGTLFVMGNSLLRPVPGNHYLLLIVSGALGIGLADTFYFMSLNRIGAGLQAIVGTSYSPSIIILSFLFLGERLSVTQFIGILLILSAVLTVISMRKNSRHLDRRTLTLGILFELLAVATQAVSIVMIKPMLGDTPLIWANCWRILGGLMMSLLLLPFLPGRNRALTALKNIRIWPVMIPGTLLGSYVSLILWLAGMKYTQASIAAALNQTATLWTFVLAAWLLQEPVTWKRIAGLAFGIVGVALVTFG